MGYTFTDYNNMVGKRPRQAYWKELQDAVLNLDNRLEAEVNENNTHETRSDNPHKVNSQQVNVIPAKPATAKMQEYPFGITIFSIAETVNTGFPDSYGTVETIHISEHRNVQHFYSKHVSSTDAGHTYYRKWNAQADGWTEWEKTTIRDELTAHTGNADIHLTKEEREKLATMASDATSVKDSTTNGNIIITDKYGIVSEVNVYSHPSGDGNLHVPATGTGNNTKILKAGNTAGSIFWGQVQFSEVGGVVTDTQHGQRGGGSLHSLVTVTNHGFMSSQDKVKLNAISTNARNVKNSSTNGNILIDDAETNVYTHPSTHPASIIVEDSTRRFVTDTEKARWNDTFTTTEINNKFSALETSMDWKESVATYDDIIRTYPQPQDGWTVNTNDTDITYRFNGQEWVAISANALPNASASVDGKMSKEDKAKLDGIAAGAEVNQNAFSHVRVATGTVSADIESDTLTFTGGTNVSLTHNADTDEIMISVSGSVGDSSTVGGLSPDTFMKKNSDSDLTFSIKDDAKSHAIRWVGGSDYHEMFVEEYGEVGTEKSRLIFLNANGGDEDHTVFRSFATATGLTEDLLGIYTSKIDVNKILNANNGLSVTGDVAATGNYTGGTFNGIDVPALKSSFDAHVGSSGAAHANVTQEVAGFMAPEDKVKVDALLDGAQPNQMAFSSVMVGALSLDAALESDSFILEAGHGMELTLNTDTKTITFGVLGTVGSGSSVNPEEFFQVKNNLSEVDRSAGKTNLGIIMSAAQPREPQAGDLWFDMSDIWEIPEVEDVYVDENFTQAQLDWEHSESIEDFEGDVRRIVIRLKLVDTVDPTIEQFVVLSTDLMAIGTKSEVNGVVDGGITFDYDFKVMTADGVITDYLAGVVYPDALISTLAINQYSA